jgi:hypothetical protein
MLQQDFAKDSCIKKQWSQNIACKRELVQSPSLVTILSFLSYFSFWQTHVAIFFLIMLCIWAKPKNETLSFPNFANNFNDSTN